MKYNNKGITIIFWVVITLMLLTVGYSILNFVFPFLFHMKGIEHSTKAYFLAYGGIENALFSKKWASGTLLRQEYSDTIHYATGKTFFSYSTVSSGTTSPQPNRGTSEWNKDFNIIGMFHPIEMEIGHNMLPNPDNLRICYRVPAINQRAWIRLKSETKPLIYWVLKASNASNESNFLMSTGASTLFMNSSFIQNSSNSNSCTSWYPFWTQTGLTLTGEHTTFTNFYNNNCRTNSCILKISIIEPLIASDNTPIPYLEYQISSAPSFIPLYYFYIDSQGVSLGFKREIHIKMPQKTGEQSFEFTVFQ